MGGFDKLLGGLAFPEGLRWRRDRLWFTDVATRRIYSCDANGIVLSLHTVEPHPVGLGWDTQGRMIVSTLERQLLRQVGSGFESMPLHDHVPFNGNDLEVDDVGRAYYGSVGAPMDQPALFDGAGAIIAVDENGVSRIAATGLSFPNGMALSADGCELIVAESTGRRLSSFRRDPDGTLHDRALFAALDTIPDGICLDPEGAVWVACPVSQEVLCVRRGGKITHRAPTGRVVLDVALGGDDGGMLYIGTAPDISHERAATGEHSGMIEQMRV